MATAASSRTTKAKEVPEMSAALNVPRTAGMLLLKAVGRIQNPSLVSFIIPTQVSIVSNPTVRIPIVSTDPFLVDTHISLAVSFSMFFLDPEAEPVNVGTLENVIGVQNDEPFFQSAPYLRMSEEMKIKTQKRIGIILRTMRSSETLKDRPELMELARSAGEDANSIITTISEEDRINMENSSARLVKSVKPEIMTFDSIEDFESYVSQNLSEEDAKNYTTTFQGLVAEFATSYIVSV